MGVEKFDEDEDFNESNLIHVRLPGRKVNTFKFLFPDRVLCKKNYKNIFILRYSRFLNIYTVFSLQIMFTNIILDL